MSCFRFVLPQTTRRAGTLPLLTWNASVCTFSCHAQASLCVMCVPCLFRVWDVLGARLLALLGFCTCFAHSLPYAAVTDSQVPYQPYHSYLRYAAVASVSPTLCLCIPLSDVPLFLLVWRRIVHARRGTVIVFLPHAHVSLPYFGTAPAQAALWPEKWHWPGFLR
jgi:hypothetical protein